MGSGMRATLEKRAMLSLVLPLGQPGDLLALRWVLLCPVLPSFAIDSISLELPASGDPGSRNVLCPALFLLPLHLVSVVTCPLESRASVADSFE